MNSKVFAIKTGSNLSLNRQFIRPWYAFGCEENTTLYKTKSTGL